MLIYTQARSSNSKHQEGGPMRHSTLSHTPSMSEERLGTSHRKDSGWRPWQQVHH